MVNNRKIVKLIIELSNNVNDWKEMELFYGNQNASTDRKLEKILETAKKLEVEYNKI